jgi:polysaccharide pyruvyl transferase WcaK-like protein
VRILVDQSGYELLNIGDVAMLQSCVLRLRHQWPTAEIMVVSHAAERLPSYCPDTIGIGRTFADMPSLQFLPRKLRLASEQGWKTAAPYLSSRLGTRRTPPARPRTAIQAVQAADLVVASGGGYMTDTWWWHAAGILSLLSLAQRLGKPTAMFGQGIGPITHRALRAQASSVMPHLKLLGLREERTGRDLSLALGTPAECMTLTGDDALEFIDSTRVADGGALGVGVRVSGYAGVDDATASAVGDVVLDAAEEFGSPIVGLPVSRYPVHSDLDALRVLLRRARGRGDIVLDDLDSPEALVSATARCRAIVTGSYHAAVFALGQGVPTVCLTKSSYYDGKFGGLQAMFPGACEVISLDAPDCAARLRTMILRAWQLPAPARAAARDAAARLREAGREAYAQFRASTEAPAMASARRRGPVT